MVSETSPGGTLTDLYESRIGDPQTDGEIWGYWLFAFGILLGIVGVLLSLNSQAAGAIRQWAIVLAATGLVFLIAGPIIRLPLQRLATSMVYVGIAIAGVAIVWFVFAYPAQWSPQTGNLLIIGLYAAGVLVIAASGAFVPVMTSREEMEAEVSALEAEIDELRDSLSDSEADNDELAEEIATIRETLSEAETESGELEQEVTQLQNDIADREAAESEMAALLNEHQASESQFELYEDRGGSWRWRLRHQEGDIIASSNEGYPRQNDAQQAMQKVRRDALGATVLHVGSEDDLPDAETTDGFVFTDEVQSQATFELYEDEGGKYRWRLRHDNGNMIAHGGQGYASRSGLEHSVERIRGYVGPAEYLQPDPTAIQIYRDEANEWRWRLQHKNGNLLAGSGEGYETRAAVREVIDHLREDIEGLEIEVYQDDAGEFRWRLDGGEGHVIADSGGYESRDGAEDAVERVRTFIPEADLIDVGEAAFEIYVDEGEEHRWRLRHRNGNVLASSGEGYASRSGVWDAIESVKRNAPEAGLEETDE